MEIGVAEATEVRTSPFPLLLFGGAAPLAPRACARAHTPGEGGAEEEGPQLFAAIGALVRRVLFEGVASKDALLALLPARLDEKLKGLIVSVIGGNLATWREQNDNSQLSLPALKGFDWRIDVKTASDRAGQMSVPTALVQMQVEEIPSAAGELAPMRTVNFEVSQETLSAMLDGMGKILEQLDSVVGGEGGGGE